MGSVNDAKKKSRPIDYYEFHIVVDDAYSVGINGVGIPNDYVVQLRNAIEEIFPQAMDDRRWKTATRTPYGSRTEIALLREHATLFIHLKDVSMSNI